MRKGRLVWRKFVDTRRTVRLRGERLRVLFPFFLIGLSVYTLVWIALQFREHVTDLSWLSLTFASLMVIFFAAFAIALGGGIVLLHAEIHTVFHYPGPDLHENGINLSYAYPEKGWIMRREFVPFSKIKSVLIDLPEDFVEAEAEAEIEESKELLEEDLESGEITMDELKATHYEAVRDYVYILTKDGKRYEFAREDFKDLKRFKGLLVQRGIKVV